MNCEIYAKNASLMIIMTLFMRGKRASRTTFMLGLLTAIYVI